MGERSAVRNRPLQAESESRGRYSLRGSGFAMLRKGRKPVRAKWCIKRRFRRRANPERIDHRQRTANLRTSSTAEAGKAAELATIRRYNKEFSGCRSKRPDSRATYGQLSRPLWLATIALGAKFLETLAPRNCFANSPYETSQKRNRARDAASAYIEATRLHAHGHKFRRGPIRDDRRAQTMEHGGTDGRRCLCGS